MKFLKLSIPSRLRLKPYRHRSMIDFKVININEVWDSIKDTDLILNLLHDEIEINDIYIYLKDNTILGGFINNVFIGFFSLEFMGNIVEGHSYTLKDFRNQSRFFLNKAIEYVFTNYDVTKIVTTVTEDYIYISRFLRLSRFKEVKTKSKIMSKNGKLLDVVYLQLNKGDFYG